jgi:PAS domain S-box-containing protein
LEEYETIFQASPIMFWYKDAENRLLRLNAAAAALDRVRPEDVEGKSTWDMHPKDQADAYYADDLEVIRSGRPKLGILEQHTAVGSGELRWLEVGKAPVRRSDGSISGVVAFAVDVTQRVQLETQLRHAQKMETVGRLAGGVAHDFNNVLAGIVGSAELIKLAGDDPNVTELADRILEASSRAAELVRGLLTFARKSPSRPTDLDLHDLVASVVQLTSAVLDRRTRIEQALEAPLRHVVGDAALIQSALLNLVFNARDALSVGGIIRVATRNVELTPDTPLSHLKPQVGGAFVEVCVSDTGHGMPPEVLGHLFEPFFTTKPAGEGTGLGLSAVYGTVRQHGGGLHVTSEVGQGSSFSVYLPLATGPASVAPSRTPADARGTECILFADDDALVRTAARDTLSALGYDVLLAADGDEAVEMHRKHAGRVRAIVLDVMMPKLGGPDAFRLIHAAEPELPVILVTGYAFEADRSELLAAGVFHILDKPYEAVQLGELIRRALDERRVTARK